MVLRENALFFGKPRYRNIRRMTHWQTISESAYPHEREALEFLRSGLPAGARLFAWSNFEFVADAGAIYEVDALVVGPWGAYLIEIKSRPGAVSGTGNFWRWAQPGRTWSDDNPLLLANRKAKALISVLRRQKAFKQTPAPFLEALVFLSHETNTLHLQGNDAFRVANRDGIIAALSRRECPGLQPFKAPPINQHQLRAFHKAMEEIGIRPLSRTRRAGDFRLGELFWDCPTGTYQDWTGEHATSPSGKRLIRVYLQNRQADPAEAEILEKAANREYHLISRLEHPGILRAETLTRADAGPAVVYHLPEGARRLDHYLAEEGGGLEVGERIDLLRKITEAVAYAHRKGIVHRALSPQSILVVPAEEAGGVDIKLYNWQTGHLQADSRASNVTRLSKTLHAGQLLEDASTVYLAPEIASGQFSHGTALDIFSLGAIAYNLFSGHAPAESTLALNDKLRQAGGFLDLRAVMNAVPEKMAELVQFSANAHRDLRYGATEFLQALDALEDELTAPPEPETVDPRRARPKDFLGHGLTVRQILGSGGISRVLLVEDEEGLSHVLKVASKPEHNERLRREFETLRKLSFKGIVTARERFDFAEVGGFTMERAGEMTLADNLRQDGRLEIEFLERFGEQLLRIVDYLDQQGVAHRDIKPDNIGIGADNKGKKRLVLFDFSLSQSPADQIHVGTPPYLDPFLENRRTRRWDSYAERFAAAMTLYEMATGGHATFGDGASAAHLTHAEANIESELFPQHLRERMAAFFRKALRADYTQRHDNAEDMLRAWKDLFRDVGKPAVTLHPSRHSDHESAVPPTDLVNEATRTTQLILLGLSTRLANAFDRVNLVTVDDLLRYPLARIQRMRGVGTKTREEAKHLFRRLRKRFPADADAQAEEVRHVADEEEASETAGIDLIARRVLALDNQRKATRDQPLLRGYLGFDPVEGAEAAIAWPSQSDFARTVDLTRARVGQIITKARERWRKVPALTGFRKMLADLLPGQGGVMARDELIEAVLHLRGSLLEDPERQRAASAALRAAIEAERGGSDPRFAEFRRGERIFIALDAALAEYARKLGDLADELAAQDPLPTPARTLEQLQAVPFPDQPGAAPPPPARLAALAAAASLGAALSPRLELYPRGLSPERALRLAQNNLFGVKTLTEEALRARILSRYPAAAPLPPRPALDELLAAANLSLRWSAGEDAYTLPTRGDSLLTSGLSTLGRTHTRTEGRAFLSEEEAEAQRLQEKLEYGHRHGSFLVLAADARHLRRAADELLHRFDLVPLDADRLFLDAMKAVAAELGVKWAVVLAADAADPASREWERLQMLLRRALPAVRATIEQAPRTVLLNNIGLFARYGQMHLLDTLRAQTGTHQGPPGLWVLIPGGDARASLGSAVIPMVNPAQFEKLNEPWLQNRVQRRKGRPA